MKKINLIIFLFIWTYNAMAQESVRLVKLSDKVSIQLPSTFRPMSEEDIQRRFLSARKPIAVFTDANRITDLSLTVGSTIWGEQDLLLMKDFYKSTFYALYDEVEFEEESIIEVNGRDFLSIKMNTVITNEDGIRKPVIKYHHILYTIYKNNLYTFNFSCPLAEKRYWQETASQSLQTIKIK